MKPDEMIAASVMGLDDRNRRFDEFLLRVTAPLACFYSFTHKNGSIPHPPQHTCTSLYSSVRWQCFGDGLLSLDSQAT